MTNPSILNAIDNLEIVMPRQRSGSRLDALFAPRPPLEVRHEKLDILGGNSIRPVANSALKVRKVDPRGTTEDLLVSNIKMHNGKFTLKSPRGVV